jgi:hypothetical protein
MLPCYLVGYAFFPFLLPHYCAVPAPVLAFTAVLALAALSDAFPKARAFLQTAGVGALLALTVLGLHEFTGQNDDRLHTPFMQYLSEEFPKQVQAPAVVLFNFDPRVDDCQQEPVFNLDAANPDDSPVIRAQDLGERNHELIEYYARTQPDRIFYLCDRAKLRVTRLGAAGELVRHGH